MTRDPAPVAADFNAQDYATLVAHPSSFWKFPEEFMCLVRLSRHYTLDEKTYPRFPYKNGEDMDLFAFIHTLDPTKVKVVERERVKDEPLIEKLFDEGGSGSQVGQGDSTGVGERTNVQPVTEATDIVTEDVAPLQPKPQRKRKTVVANAVHRFLAGAVLNVEVKGEPIPTFPFVTSSVYATLEREGADHTDSVIGLNHEFDLRRYFTLTQTALDAFCQKYHIPDTVHPVLLGPNQNICNSPAEIDLFAFIHHVDPTKVWIGERQIEKGQVPLLDSTEGRVIPFAGEDSQTVIVLVKMKRLLLLWMKSFRLLLLISLRVKGKAVGASGSDHPPKKLREDHGTSGDAGASTGGKSLVALQGLLERSTLAVEVGVTATATVPFVTSSVTPTAECEGDGNTDSIYGTNLRTQRPSKRSFVPPPPVMSATVTTTNVASAFFAPSVLDDPDVCRSVIDQLAPPNLFSQLRSMDYDQLFSKFNVGVACQTCLNAEADPLKEKDIEITNLKAQLSLKEVEAIKAIHLHKQVSVVEAAKVARSATAAKEIELTSLTPQTAKLTQDLSSLELSCDELSVKSASLESQIDAFTDQVSLLETTCSRLYDQVFGYELFKERCEAIQDEQVNALSDRVAGLDSELMALALHLDEEFYPCFLTTIAGRQWIIGHGLRLAVMKCHQSPDYDASFGTLESQKDASTADIMSLLCLEGPFAETPEVSRLQSSYEQLLFPVHRKEDNVVTEKTSPSDSLDVVHARVQKLNGGALSHRLSISNVIGVLAYPLSSKNLIGEASTLGVPVTAAVTTALAISVTATNISSIPPISMADYDMVEAGVQDTAPHSPKIVFQKEDLESTPDHPSAS
uniref:Transposase (Putative), gypsy type n=1 Tax=Tanacetum cinerariifolium TaxID=118510 RepID=A0A6L2JHI6_TANCI|nr:hypothetical protein [Tanacetum cinerariifolium]